jgi:HEPN domain-containing protein
LAHSQGQGILLEDLCYQAQQAAEKALKAVFISKGKLFPFTHDLDRLLLELEGMGMVIDGAADQAGFLTRYAVETRYPYASEPVERAEYGEALHLAESVLAWATLQVGR